MILINSSPKNALKLFQPFLPISVPMGVGSLLAVMEREGIETFCVDEQVEFEPVAKIREYVKSLSPPYIFAFSVLTPALKSAVDMSKKLKELYPDSVILFGGIHPSAAPEEVLGFEHVDYAFRGEGDVMLPEFYKRIKAGRDVRDMKGLSYIDNGEIVHNPPSELVLDLDSLPAFAYHRFEEHRLRYDLGFVTTSRGCPHKCVFCSNRVPTGKQYRFRSSEKVMEDLTLLREKYGMTRVFFLDDNFLVHKERLLELAGLIRKKGYHECMTFDFQGRADQVDVETMTELYKSGFRGIFIGLETASEEMMSFIDKGETVEQCVNAVRVAKKVGFHVGATFIYGLPGDTHELRMECLRLSKELDLDMIRYNNATPYPGTRLYDIAKSEGRLKVQGIYENFCSVSAFIENPFRKIPFSYVPEGCTENELRVDTLASYLAFYMAPRKIWSILTKPDKNVGWFSAGESFVGTLKLLPAIAVLLFFLCVKFGELLLRLTFPTKSSTSWSKFIKMMFVRPLAGREDG